MSLKIYLSWVWFGPSCLGPLERWPSGQSQFIPGQRRPSAGCNTYCRDARAWERAMPKVRFAQSDLIRTKKPPGSSESFRAFFFSLLLIGNLKVLKTLESGSSLERSHSTLKIWWFQPTWRKFPPLWLNSVSYYLRSCDLFVAWIT